MSEAEADIFEAIRAGDADRVRRVLEADAAAATRRNEQGVSALLFARYHSKQDIVEVILSLGAKVDAFEAAALGQNARLTEILASDGSVANEYSNDGYTPLHLAAFFGHQEAAGLLLSFGANAAAVSRNEMRVTPLHSAIAGGHLSLARLLIDHGADVNARQQGGWTPLHEAAQNGDEELVEYLLYKGADPAAAKDDGKTAADIAREQGHNLVVQTLTQR